MMKITEFLKKYSLIDNKFIDDFYSFYDKEQNEYDYTIDLNKLAYWLEIKKFHLMRLLESNFYEEQDYIIENKSKNGKGKGKGGNNTKVILLTYTCAKLLCMISRTPKADVIRKFYIDLEKLIITYKDSIVKDLNNQLGIKISNKKIIDENKNKGLIYILKIDDSQDVNSQELMDVKIGSTNDIEARMKQYNVGRINELPIVFVYLSDNIDELELCIKQNLKSYQIKYNTETFNIDVPFIKDTIKYCTKKNALLLKQNKKLFNKKDNKKFLIIIDKERLDRVDEILGKINKMSTKKSSKISPKKITKKSSKKTSKILPKKITKKSSKKSSKILPKKTIKKPSTITKN